MAKNGHSVVRELSVREFRKRRYGVLSQGKVKAIDSIHIFLRVLVNDRITALSLKHFRGNANTSSLAPFLFAPSSMNALKNALVKAGVHRSLIEDAAAYVEVEVGKKILRKKKRRK